MRRAAIVAFALFAAVVMLTAPPAQAASVNYRIADSTSELQNGTLSNARATDGVVQPGTFDATLDHRYPLNDGTSDVIGAADFSGSTTSTTGIAGNGRNIDRGDTLSGSPGLGSSYSVAFWINPDGDGTVYDDRRLTLGYNGGDLVVLTDGSATTTTTFTAGIPTGQWTHLSLVVRSNTVHVYADGNFVGRADDLVSQSDNVTFGGGSDGVTGGTTGIPADWDGQIDEIRFGDQTPGELARLGSAPEAPAGGDPALAERWAFDAGTDTVAYGDEGTDAAITNGQWVSGQSGQALEFDGDGYADPDSDPSASGSFTISTWVRLDAPAQESNFPVIAGYYQRGWIYYAAGPDAVLFSLDDSGGARETVGTAAPSGGTWTHATAVFDANADEMRLFIDGVEVGSAEITDHEALSGFSVGGSVSTRADRANMTLDDVRVYERALSDSEITYLADHPGAELARGDYQGQARSVEATTGYTDFNALQNAEATVTWQGYDGSSWTDIKTNTYTTAGNKSVSLPEGQFQQYRPDVSLRPTDPDYRAELDATGVSFAGSAPTLSNPQPTGTLTSFDGTLEIDVADPDFGDAEGDSVTVTASNQNGQIGSTTVTQNGTATIPYDALAGTNDISWSASDSYGDSAPSPPSQSFTLPDQLIVRNESDTDQIVSTDSEITATFFSDDGQEVVEKTSTDGTFSLAGLPADKEYVVDVDADGYRARQVIITSLYDQQNVYLLPQSAPGATIEFQLNDETGRFPADQTTLFVEKPIRRNNNTEFRTVFADEFGATDSLRIDLRDATRYRLKVRNGQGEVRVLSSYTTSGDAVAPLTIGQVEVAGEVGDAGVAFDSQVIETDQGRAIRIVYRDPEQQTDDVEVAVSRNGSQYVPNISGNTTDGRLIATVPVDNSTPANATFNVSFAALRGGETFTGNTQVGGVGELDVPVPPLPLSLLSWTATLGLMSMVVIRSPRLAPATGTATASAFTVFGWLSIPAAALGIAGAISVLAVYGRGGGQ